LQEYYLRYVNLVTESGKERSCRRKKKAKSATFRSVCDKMWNSTKTQTNKEQNRNRKRTQETEEMDQFTGINAEGLVQNPRPLEVTGAEVGSATEWYDDEGL
jgi:hypothetical protein